MENKENIGRLDRIETDVKVLKSDVKVLKSDVKELKGDMKGVKTGVAKLQEQHECIQDTLAFMVRKMDQQWEQTERLFGVKDEKAASDLQGLGEGVRANRERGDDHEARLESLEAS